MNIVIFAGGVGTRLWPLSRKRSPKQFEKVVGDKSTLQLAVDRILPAFPAKNIYISTNKEYVPIVRRQLPDIPPEHIVGEPAMRDVGPAVGLMTAILHKEAPRTPMAILWSDHLVKNEELFRQALKTAEDAVKTEPSKIVFIAQKARFASQNLGWIECGSVRKKVNRMPLYSFVKLKYRPDEKTAEHFFASGRHAWNLGYFVTTPAFLWKKYEEFVPDLYHSLHSIRDAWGTKKQDEAIGSIYPGLEKIHFDNAILECLNPSEAYVISDDFQWSDIGAWEALKDALQKNPSENVILGNVLVKDSKDCLVYNYNNKQILITIDLDGFLVVNTGDVTLVCRKDSVPKIKKIVESMSGTEKDYLT